MDIDLALLPFGKLSLKREERDFMKLENIRELLEIMCNFNHSAITHTFAVEGSDEKLTVICIQETYILEVTSSEHEETKNFSSVDEAANFLYGKIHLIGNN